MPAATWLETVAADLLETETDIRRALRTLSHSLREHGHAHQVSTPRGKNATRTLTISEKEARTLIRAAMPLPISSTRLRQPHARLATALALFSGHLLATHERPDLHDVTAAAITLRAELDRWLTACTAAHVRWPQSAAEPIAVSAILRQQTGADHEQAANEPLNLTITGLAAGVPEDAGTYIRANRRRHAAEAQAKLELDQAADPPPVPLHGRRVA